MGSTRVTCWSIAQGCRGIYRVNPRVPQGNALSLASGLVRELDEALSKGVLRQIGDGMQIQLLDEVGAM